MNAHADVIRNALDHVVGGGDLATDDLIEIREDALASLDEMEREIIFLNDKLDNIQSEVRRPW